MLAASDGMVAHPAQEELTPRPQSTLAVALESDLFTGSDNNATNGFGITWQADEYRDCEPESPNRRWVDFWSFLPLIGNENCQVVAAWALGQEISTPDDITADPPLTDDQPRAGVLFLDSTLYASSKRVTHAWNLRLGLVGPGAGAQQTQAAVHNALGVGEPRGWG